MKHQKQTKRRTGLVVCAVLAVLLALTLAGAAFLVISNDGSSAKESSDLAKTEAKAEEGEGAKTAAGESSGKDGDEMDPMQTISTPYMDFTCSKWIMDSIETSEISEDGIYRLDLTGLVADQEIELFSLIFAKDSSEGYLMGTFESEDEGAVEVRIVIEPLERSDSWNDEQTNEASMLQEYVNDVIDQLNESERFTSAEE